MEKAPGHAESLDQLIEKYHLSKGDRAALEKIAINSSSSVPVGSMARGTLRHTVEIGEPITFQDSGAVISAVKKIEERNGELLIHTNTSIYRLHPEDTPSNTEHIQLEDVAVVETAKGSTYRYLPDGTTQRFKKVESKEYEPQAALVYVPNYAWVKENAPKELLPILGNNETDYDQTLLEYVQNPYKENKKVYIVDKEGKVVETNELIKKTEGPIYLAFLTGDTTDFYIPVSHTPKIGFMTFDTRRYVDEKTGESMRERHLGNEVVRIVRKELKNR